MDQNNTESGEFADWIAAHWAPELADTEAFLAGLAEIRRRRRVRNDMIGVGAMAAAALLFVGSTPAIPEPGWLASTSLAEVSSPTLPADLAALRSSFLGVGQIP